MESLTIIGRRWFRRSAGNTYNTAEIIVDGELVHKTPRQYGYGDHYLDLAAEWLEANGYLPQRQHYTNGGADPLWAYCRERRIAFTASCVDVPRQKDL